MKKALWLLSLLVLTVSLTACGGSSGSSDTTTTPTSGLSGAVAAAPVKDAKVYAKYTSLTAEAQAADSTKSDLLVGTTDANGAIVFDAAAVAKLDRSKNVFLYSKDGVKFASKFDTRKMVTEAAAPEGENYFYGSLRAVLAPEATTAYLTVANTLVADLVADGATYVDATNTVLNFVQNRLGVTAMANPLGNPLESLERAEFVSQAVLISFGVSEAAVTDGTAKFGDIKTTIDSKKVAVDYDAVLDAVKKALKKDGYDIDVVALEKGNTVSSTPLTYVLKFDTSASAFKTKFGAKAGARDYYVLKADADNAATDMSFTLVAKINSDTDPDSGRYMLKSYEGQGTLQQGAVDVKDGDVFSTLNKFSIAVPVDSKGDAIKGGFTNAKIVFVAVDKDNQPVKGIEEVVVTVKVIDEKEVIVAENGFSATKPTSFNISLKNDVVPADSNHAKRFDSDSSSDAITFTSDITLLNDLKAEDAKDKVFVRVTAPAGFVFTGVNKDQVKGEPETSDKLTSVEVPVTADGDTTATAEFAAKMMYNVAGTEDFKMGVLKTEVLSSGIVIAEKEYTLGFAADATYFDTVRDYALTSVAEAVLGAKATKVALKGEVKATFSTWGYEVAAANAALPTDKVTNDSFNTYKAYAVAEAADQYDTLVGEVDKVGGAGTATSFAITPAVIDVKAINKGVVTLTFDLADSNGEASGTDPVTFKHGTEGKYFVRIDLADTITNNASELQKAGGLKVELVTPKAVEVTSAKLKGSAVVIPTQNQGGTKTFLVKNAESTDALADIDTVTYTVEIAEAEKPEFTTIATGWTFVAGLDGCSAVTTTAVTPTVKKVGDVYELTFDINGKKVTSSNNSDQDGTIKVSRASADNNGGSKIDSDKAGFTYKVP
jgi:hypothetical protein